MTPVDMTPVHHPASSSHTPPRTSIIGFAALSLALHIVMLMTTVPDEAFLPSLSRDSAEPTTFWVTLTPPDERIPPSLTQPAPAPVPASPPTHRVPPPEPASLSLVKTVPRPMKPVTSNTSNFALSSVSKPSPHEPTPNAYAVEAPRPSANPSSPPIQNTHPTVPEPAAGASDDDPRDAIRAHLREFITRNKIYPALALRKGWHGDVVLVLSVTPQGAITTIQIAQSSGYKILDENALGLIRRAPPVPVASLGHSPSIDLDLQISYQFN